MLTNIPVLVGGAVLALLLKPFILYFLDPKSLRQFPSPAYAALSSLWRILQNVRYSHYKAIDHAHQELGTHVRIAPNHISISDPQAVVDIYGHGANFLKDAWYDGGAGEFRHMADSRIKSEHQAKRKMLAHVFAQKTVANLEPVIAEQVAVLVGEVEKVAKAGGTINMRRYLNYFTIDTFSRLLYGEPQGCLTRGNDTVTAETGEGKVYKAPFIKSLHDATQINTILGMESGILPLTRKLFAWHPYKKAGADYDNIIYHSTMKRLSDPSPPVTDDIFSKLITNNKGDPVGLCTGDLLAECSVMMNAGTDTTTAALTNTLYLLTKKPAVLTKLRAEISTAVPEDVVVPSYDCLSNLPYLRACIEESLRLRPASSFGLPRVVPKGGRTIAGKFIPEDVTVSVPTYTLLRNESCFKDPLTFRPDRWIEDDKVAMAKAHFPFSTGPRACIGRNIAYFELAIVVAALVTRFDWSFEGGEAWELETVERFNGNPGEMVMFVEHRVKI
jgi:cytochrome P450